MDERSEDHRLAERDVSILVLEPREDHAQLMREALEERLPEARVRVASSPPAPSKVTPRVVVIATSVDSAPVCAWLDALTERGHRPSVVLVAAGAEGPTESLAAVVEPSTILEKAEGSQFLGELSEVVATLAEPDASAATREADATPALTQSERREPSPTPIGAIYATRAGDVLDADAGAARLLGVSRDDLIGRRSLDEILSGEWRDLRADAWLPLHALAGLSARLIEAAAGAQVLLLTPGEDVTSGSRRGEFAFDSSPATIGHRHSVVTGVLARELIGILGTVGSLGELARAGQGGAGDIEGYWKTIDGAIERARAVARRIETIHSVAGPQQRSYRMDLGDFIRLRLDAWSLLVPEAAAMRFEPAAEALPVRICPGVLGPALDALLQARNGEGELTIATSRVVLDEEFHRSHPGSQMGRMARLRFGLRAASPGGEGEDVDAPAMPAPMLNLLIAALKTHGGYLDARRHAGSALVDVYLPLSRTPPLDELDRAPTVLIVDDEASVRQVATEILTQAGFRAVAASSGEEAVDLYLAGCRYDLVFLDYVMEGIDGAQTFESLRIADPSLRAVLCTGSPERVPIMTLLEKGMLGLILKPFRMTRLLEIARAALATS